MIHVQAAEKDQKKKQKAEEQQRLRAESEREEELKRQAEADRLRNVNPGRQRAPFSSPAKRSLGQSSEDDALSLAAETDTSLSHGHNSDAESSGAW